MKFILENVERDTFYYCCKMAKNKEGELDFWVVLDNRSKTAHVEMKDWNDIGPSMDVEWTVAMLILENCGAEIEPELYEE